MAQNVLLKYGDTSVISGETIQQGKLLIDTQKAEISIDKDGTSRVKLTPTVDSALSTTSTNAIANNAITNSIINTTAEVSAITADNIPCGTKPVKELITNLTINYGTCTTYSATATYALNSLVIYSNRLYKCTTAITVAEAWNSAKWTAIADTNNGTVYNTTDSSFYGVRGADSVLKKLGSPTKIKVTNMNIGTLLSGTGIDYTKLTIDNFYYKTTIARLDYNANGGTTGLAYGSMSYNSSTGILTYNDGTTWLDQCKLTAPQPEIWLII